MTVVEKVTHVADRRTWVTFFMHVQRTRRRSTAARALGADPC
jgi:hypothetical protein